MATRTLIVVILLGTFGMSFILSTILFDSFAKERGFYDEGIRQTTELYKEF